MQRRGKRSCRTVAFANVERGVSKRNAKSLFACVVHVDQPASGYGNLVDSLDSSSLQRQVEIVES